MSTRTIANKEITAEQKLQAILARLLLAYVQEDNTALPVIMTAMDENPVEGVDHKDPHQIMEYLTKMGEPVLAAELYEDGDQQTAYNLGGIIKEIVSGFDGSGEGYDVDGDKAMGWHHHCVMWAHEQRAA